MTVTRERLSEIAQAMDNQVALFLEVEEMREIIALAEQAYDARMLMGELVPHLRKGEHGLAIGLIKAWFDTNVALQAPCTDQSGCVPSPSDATVPSQPPEAAPHKDAPPPAAATSGPPGKSTDGPRLPAQPADATPLERHERVCADKLASSAEAFMNSFREHLDKCRTCQINWQSMRKALGEYQGCTR